MNGQGFFDRLSSASTSSPSAHRSRRTRANSSRGAAIHLGKGEDPGHDSVSYVTAVAQARGLERHAWLAAANRANQDQSTPRTSVWATPVCGEVAPYPPPRYESPDMTRLPLLVLVLVALACGDDATTVDASVRFDAGGALDGGRFDAVAVDAGPAPEDGGLAEDSAAPLVDASMDDVGGGDAGTPPGACEAGGDAPYVGMSGVVDFPSVGTVLNMDMDVGCDGVARAAYLDSESLDQNEIVIVRVEADEWMEDARIPLSPAVRYSLGTGHVHLRVGLDGITRVLFVDWLDNNTRRLRYAESPSFVAETVVEFGRLTLHDLHLELGDDSSPHVAYMMDNVVHYASRESGSWIGEVAVSIPGGYVGRNIDLALRGTIPTVISRLAGSAGSSVEEGVFVYTREERGFWTEQATLDYPEGTIDYSADWVGDTLHLAWIYYNRGTYEAWVGTWRDGTLSDRLLIDDTVDYEFDDIAGFQLVADETGRPHIIVAASFGVQHATVRAGRVVIRSLGVAGSNDSAAIAVDRFQGVHLAYQTGRSARFQRVID